MKEIPEPVFDDSAFYPPKEYRTHPNDAKAEDIQHLIQLIEDDSPETVIDQFLTKHKELLTFVMKYYSTGHHHSWVIPKKAIKSKFYSADKGLIPDYILGGQSTSGKEWFIVELKGANVNWFIEKHGHIYFSDVINKGIHQLMEYQYHCDRYQAKFRDEHGLTDFHFPRAILIAGRREEFEKSPRKQLVKKTWEKLLGDRLVIMTYDRFKDQLKSRLNDFKYDEERKKYPQINPFLR